MGKTLKYEGEYSSYIESLFMIISRCALHLQEELASLPFIVCWIGLSHMLSFCRSYSFCPTSVSRMLEMNTHFGFSVSYTEFTAYVRGGGDDSLLSLALLFESSFSSKLIDGKHWAEDTAEADCWHEMWVTFLCM
jgi:hypothetical protein